ncbi:hypothetical protein [Candidatus Lokiarchaeum ossiferum]|uniref:hypothetical protein n=1 Tax=Candidatus Lokiarchaeum ossiferum TaxID=2951803 RepID=UPI00352DEF45
MNGQPDQQENQVHLCKKCNQSTPHSLCENCNSWVCDYCSFGCSNCEKVICSDCLKVVLAEEYDVVGSSCPYCEGIGKIRKVKIRSYHSPKKSLKIRILGLIFWLFPAGVVGILNFFFLTEILPSEDLAPILFAGVIVGIFNLAILGMLPRIIRGNFNLSAGVSFDDGDWD